jgi:hypothetical protein
MGWASSVQRRIGVSIVNATSNDLTVNITDELYGCFGDKLDWALGLVKKYNSGGYPYEDMSITAHLTKAGGTKADFTLEMHPDVFTELVKTIIDYYFFHSRENELKEMVAGFEEDYKED